VVVVPSGPIRHEKLQSDVICLLAESYVSGAAHEAGAAAELTASHKEEKYANIEGCYIFEPKAIKTLGEGV